MPIEAAQPGANQNVPPSVHQAFVHESCGTLQSAVNKIRHCVDQLTDADVAWRPHESHNSIQNIILHLCGNVRQWIIHGITGTPDQRNRPLEFSDRKPRKKSNLLELLDETVAQAVRAISPLTPQQLLEPRRIQGFDTYVLAAIWDSVSHFVGHTHQIVYITRQIIGDAYRFQFVPASAEQGAPP